MKVYVRVISKLSFNLINLLSALLKREWVTESEIGGFTRGIAKQMLKAKQEEWWLCWIRKVSLERIVHLEWDPLPLSGVVWHHSKHWL